MGDGREQLTTLHVRRAQAEYRLGPRLRRHVDPDDMVQEVWATALPRLPELGECPPPSGPGSHSATVLKFSPSSTR